MLRPAIYQVIPTSDYKVYVCFDDGTIKLYDVMPLIKRGGIFEQLKDIEVFKKTCTIMNGTLAWDIGGNRDTAKCIDVCPDKIYNEGVSVQEIFIA